MSDLLFELQDDELRRAIGNALALLQRPRPIMDAIGARLKTNAELRFDAKRDPAGQAWAPLSPKTIAIYQSEWFIKQNPAFAGGIPGSLLERTRLLRASLGYNASDDAVEIGTSRATAGGKWQIGWLHETGTRRMTRRGFLVADPKTGELSPGDTEDILEVVVAAISGAFE